MTPAFPRPAKRPKKSRNPLRRSRPGTRRRVAGPRPSDALAHPKPRREPRTKHARRVRERGRMAFYSNMGLCLLRAMALTYQVGPDEREAAKECRGPIEVAHLGPRAGWRRGKDEDTAPLCRKHHRDIDGTVGGRGRWFAAMSRHDQWELRQRLVIEADHYWRMLTDAQRAEWDAQVEEGRKGARR